jgi:hypothetical protein
MKEGEGNRRYKMELGGAMVVYMAVLFIAISLGRPMQEGPLRTLVLSTPIVPLMLAVGAIARHIRRMDEFLRLRALESLALASAITAVFTFSYGFLETAGFPKISMFWVWPIMAGAWGLHSALRCVFRR